MQNIACRGVSVYKIDLSLVDAIFRQTQTLCKEAGCHKSKTIDINPKQLDEKRQAAPQTGATSFASARVFAGPCKV